MTAVMGLTAIMLGQELSNCISGVCPNDVSEAETVINTWSNWKSIATTFGIITMVSAIGAGIAGIARVIELDIAERVKEVPE